MQNMTESTFLPQKNTANLVGNSMIDAAWGRRVRRAVSSGVETGARYELVQGSRELQRIALEVAKEEKITLRRGVYVAVPGPNLETRAEYRFLRSAGADVVGMSTVPEVIVAIHGGMRVLGVSIITDMCLPDALKPANVEEIIRIAGQVEPQLTQLIRKVAARLGA